MEKPQLNVRRAKFCGRSAEISKLQGAFEHVSLVVETPVAHSVFLKGESGSGKSALVRAFQKALMKNKERCIFCRGKFEEGGAAAEPFGAVLQACNSMVLKLLEGNVESWRERFDKELSNQDVTILRNIIPSIQDLLVQDEEKHNAHSEISDTALTTDPFHSETEWSFNKLRYALRSLIRTVSQFIPLILFMDDLQWAGEDSLLLIQTLLCDKMPGRRMMLIGAYRPVNDDHPLALRILSEPWSKANTNVSAQTRSPSIIAIELGNLCELETSEVLANVLGLQNTQGIRTLSTVVFRKTNGNPFFLLHFLRLLEQDGYLYYSKDSCQWEWRSDFVFHEANILEKVTDVVKEKMGLLSKQHQSVLSSAACLGVLQFKVKTLAIVLHGALDCKIINIEDAGKSSFDCETESLDEGLVSIADSGLIEESKSPGCYQFVHDRMREGAYFLFSRESDRVSSHLDMGRRLLLESNLELDENGLFHVDTCDEEIILHAVNQLNLGMSMITDKEERRKVARLNYAMAEMSYSRSAFFPASEFLRSGIAVMGDDVEKLVWLHDYSLLLNLFLAKARIDYCCGSWQTCIEHADVVIKHAKTLREKKPAYHAKVLCLVQQGKTAEARELIVSVLGQLGVSFPGKWKIFHILKEAIQTKRMLQRFSDEDLINLPATSNPNANLTCDFFHSLMDIGYVADNGDVYTLLMIAFRMVQMSLTDGRFQLTGFSLVGYGGILAKIQRFPEAYRLGKIGSEMALTDGFNYMKAINVFHTFIVHWQMPFHYSMDKLSSFIDQFSYSEATGYAATFCLLYFICGKQLDYMKQAIIKVVEALEDYNEHTIYDVFCPLFQLVSILTGNNPTQVCLTGEFMDEDSLLRNSRSNRANMRIFLYKLFLGYIFDNLVVVEASLEKMKAFKKHLAPSTDRAFWHLMSGLGAFALAKSKCKNPWEHYSFKRKGRAAMGVFRSWRAKGVPSAVALKPRSIRQNFSCRFWKPKIWLFLLRRWQRFWRYTIRLSLR